jgi:hypothetical protein
LGLAPDKIPICLDLDPVRPKLQIPADPNTHHGFVALGDWLFREWSVSEAYSTHFTKREEDMEALVLQEIAVSIFSISCFLKQVLNNGTVQTG